MPDNPDTLPADFFSKKQSQNPDTLPADFFHGGAPVPGLTPGAPSSDAAGRFANGLASAINPVPGIAAIAGDPQGLRHGIEQNVFQPQVAQFTRGMQAARGQGEFSGMTPGERGVSAAGHFAAGALPLVGPSAAAAGEQIGSGDVAGGVGSGVGLLANMATPGVLRGTGKAISGTAEPIAENALGIRSVDRKFGRNPGRAALDETSGVRPATVQSQASTRVGELARQRDALLRTSPNDVSLQPSRASVTADINKAGAGNSLTGSLEKVQEHLTEPHPGFAGATSFPPGATQPVTFQQTPSPILGPTGHPAAMTTTAVPGPAPMLTISELQRPMDALAIRQRLGNDFTKFDMARPVSREQMAVGNKAYGNLTSAIHTAVPESAPLDTRISNLIPVRDSAAVKDIQPGVTGNVLMRAAAKTGSLAAGTLAGAHYGNPVAGAVMGAAVPEILSNPTAQMLAARGIDSTGKVIRNPVLGRALQGAQLVRPAQAAR